MSSAPWTPWSGPASLERQDHITPDPQAGEDDFDEGYDAESDRSSLTSVATHIRNGIFENGRLYAAYGQGEYGLPRDEQEMDRIDMAHEKYRLLMGEKRFLAPIEDSPRNVLDLGTGSGIWSVDFADKYPSAEVIGIDLSPTQPGWVPPNCRFEIDDIEAPWTFREKNHFDFIFSRDLYFSIRDWPNLIRQCFEYCAPGGYVEFECIYGVLGCDDGTLDNSVGFKEYDRLIIEAARAFGTPLEAPAHFGEWFEAAGFENVVNRQFKLPSSPWPKDKRLKLIGLFERENLLGNLEGMSVRLLQKGLGWTPVETQILVSKVHKDLKNPAIHCYYPMMVTYGRKPLTATS